MSQPLSTSIKTAIAALNSIPKEDRSPTDEPFIEMLVHLHTFACSVERSRATGDDRLALVRGSMASAELYRCLSEEQPTAHVIDLSLWTSAEGRA